LTCGADIDGATDFAVSNAVSNAIFNQRLKKEHGSTIYMVPAAWKSAMLKTAV
jgi:hypothetical protein